VNACLSFGYAFLGSLLEGVVQRAGLDPLLGFLHEPVRGRSSLVLDLLEEFRAPVVDSTVLRTINRRQLTPGDFRMPGLEDRAAAVLEGEEPSDPMPAEAVYLGPSGRKVFLAELLARLREEVRYEPRDERRSYRAILLEQAQSMSRAVEGDSDGYRPFAWR
jgi:CRISPR-associated protein Cas1